MAGGPASRRGFRPPRRPAPRIAAGRPRGGTRPMLPEGFRLPFLIPRGVPPPLGHSANQCVCVFAPAPQDFTAVGFDLKYGAKVAHFPETSKGFPDFFSLVSCARAFGRNPPARRGKIPGKFPRNPPCFFAGAPPEFSRNFQ